MTTKNNNYVPKPYNNNNSTFNSFNKFNQKPFNNNVQKPNNTQKPITVLDNEPSNDSTDASINNLNIPDNTTSNLNELNLNQSRKRKHVAPNESIYNNCDYIDVSDLFQFTTTRTMQEITSILCKLPPDSLLDNKPGRGGSVQYFFPSDKFYLLLNYAAGTEGWKEEVINCDSKITQIDDPSSKNHGKFMAICDVDMKLTITSSEGKEITHSNFTSCEHINPSMTEALLKAKENAIPKALRRCGIKFGPFFGLHLYDKKYIAGLKKQKN